MLLFYKLQTFKNCKEVKHIILITATIYFFFYLMWYLINSWKLISENLQPLPPEKILSPFLLPPPKNSEGTSPPFLPKLIFQAPHLQKGRGVHCAYIISFLDNRISVMSVILLLLKHTKNNLPKDLFVYFFDASLFLKNFNNAKKNY